MIKAQGKSKRGVQVSLPYSSGFPLKQKLILKSSFFGNPHWNTALISGGKRFIQFKAVLEIYKLKS